MKPKNLLSQLSELETTLNNFSFEELSTDQATRLKKSFEAFKTHLEKRIWGEDIPLNQDSRSESIKEKEQLQKAQEMLIATVSHEIRTPLSGIIGFADLLREGELSEDQQHQVNAIQSASNSLMDIINELLEYSKLSAGLENFEMLDFNFFSIVQDVVYLCNTLMLGKDAKLEVDVDKNIPENLIGDPSKLSQILLNLLGNSIKFVEEGEIMLKIKLLRQGEEKVTLEFIVTDTGIGISKEDLEHIFGSFKQANQQTFSKYGGAGLGLNIVKQIVDKLNGDIKVESTLGIGTTFKFTLPYATGSSTAISKSKPTEISSEEVKGMRILVFEDNVLNQRLIERRLNSWGCKTYITENPIYGLNLLETNAIDIVLMDLRMPIMSGFEVTQKIRKSTKKEVAEIPIIALTADFTFDDKNECENSGINDFILKPFSPEELLSKLIKNRNDLQTNFKLNASSDDNQDDHTVVSESSFDLNSVLEDCMGELELLEELTGLYKRNALEFIGNVKMKLQDGDIEGVAFAAHKIKCGLKMMQTMELFSIVEQLNTTAKTTKDINHMQFLLNRFVQEYPKAEKMIDEELRRLNKNSYE